MYLKFIVIDLKDFKQWILQNLRLKYIFLYKLERIFWCKNYFESIAFSKYKCSVFFERTELDNLKKNLNSMPVID